MTRVLFVEDDRSILECYADVASDLRLDATYARTVLSALSALSSGDYDAVVLDHDLGIGGGGTGLDVLRAIRGAGLTPRIAMVSSALWCVC